MKIGLFLPQDVPETGGGFTFRDELATNLMSLVPTLSDGRHEASVLRLPNIKDKNRSLVDKVKLLPSAILRRMRLSQEDRVLLEKKIDCSGVDLLWFIDSHVMDTDLPYFVTVFDLQHRLQPWFPEVSSKGTWEYREQLYSKLLQRAAYIISGSPEGSDEVRNFYGIPDFRRHVIPLPTPSAAFAEEVNSRNSDMPIVDGEYFYYPAQIWPHKNHQNLFAAWRILKEKTGANCPTLVLSGANKGYQDVLINTIEEFGISDCCRYLGFVESQAVYEIMAGAQGLVFPTLFGPDNIPPLEAMAIGVPVILSDLPGCRAMYGDAVTYVDPLDPFSIAIGVERVLHLAPLLRQEMIKTGIEYANGRTITTYIEKIVSLLDSFESYRKCWR